MSSLFILDQCLFLVSTGDLEHRPCLDRRLGKEDLSRPEIWNIDLVSTGDLEHRPCLDRRLGKEDLSRPEFRKASLALTGFLENHPVAPIVVLVSIKAALDSNFRH